MPYKLIYWPGIPGRGEFIRLAFEEAAAAYTDTAQTADGLQALMDQIGPDSKRPATAHPPPLAPPILQNDEDRLVISQTGNILLYLGPRLGLVPDGSGGDPNAAYYVHSLALTALDGLCSEVHNCHHPVSTALYYEDQKPESLRTSQAFVTSRLPKFLEYFERVLCSAASSPTSSAPASPWLYGGRLTYADLVLFQSLDGTAHQFPRAVHHYRESGQYARVFALYRAVKKRPNIAAYLASERRQHYGMGIYRYYKELDVLPGEGESACGKAGESSKG